MFNRKTSFFNRTKHPYYIAAPEFRQNSSGIRVLHYLCHALNESGHEAYITAGTNGTNPFLRTPRLTPEIRENHKASGCIPIGVYPEVAHGNILNLSVIARWILNKPGHLGGEQSFAKEEILFYWDEWVIDTSIVAEKLKIPFVDRRIFHEPKKPTERKGFCYYAHKYLAKGHKISHEVIKKGTSLCQDVPRSHEEIAEILRNSEVLYCYEPTALIAEALACCCPVFQVDTPYLDLFNSENNPIKRIKESEIGIPPFPQLEINSIISGFESFEIDAWKQIKNFINKTQAAARKQAKQMVSPKHKNLAHPEHLASPIKHKSDSQYKTWLSSRAWILNLNTSPKQKQETPHLFHLIAQLPPSEMSAFANTLDSLATQIHQEWVLDVFSETPAPEGLEEIPCIHWHTLEQDEAARGRINQRIAEFPGDWIIDLPAGVKLDPLFLWRLATAAIEQPESKAFFVDDDCYSEDGVRNTPRFKPGCNPAALLSSDLAGVLCVRREAWLALANADISTRNNFALLLGIAGRFGWHSIKHIPDVLLSYPDTCIPNSTDCITELREHLERQGIAAQILHSGKQSWCIRRPLVDEPRVSVVIASEGKYELLARCLESLCALTQYKNFDILVSLKADDALPDILTLLREQAEKSGVSIRPELSPVGCSYANRCNSTVDRINSEFIVFLKEEAQIIQETWLGELVRTATEDSVAAVMPRLVAPGSAKIENIGYVLGLGGVRGLPYHEGAIISDAGYLDYIQMPRDISLLPHACYLIKKQNYTQVGGMDGENFPDHWADADLSMKLRRNGERIICQPLSNLVVQITDEYDLPQTVNELAHSILSKKNQEEIFIQHWWPNAAVDPFWNRNLSLQEKTPTPEIEVIAPWQFAPTSVPRIFARPVPNGQGVFRITAPLTAACNAGLAAQCIWQQDVHRDLTAAELIRLAPDTAIAQNYFNNLRLSTLEAWCAAPGRPFIVYTIDDLMTNLPEFNPFKVTQCKNPHGRLQHALKHCDRLVVSTDYLANAYSHLISDIRVVPNCLEQGLWLPLQTRKRTSKKPRIGWAGGTTHQGDLLLLKEIIERTRDEADWILMGMCPDEIRPLLTEFHPFIDQNEYPAYLASLNLDIAVAPLAQLPFNQGKSNLRLLEYGILGLPVVCTDIDPYRNSPACCVTNTVDAWVSALRERIHDADAREAEGRAMRRWVLANYLLEDHLTDWLDAHLPAGYSTAIAYANVVDP